MHYSIVLLLAVPIVGAIVGALLPNARSAKWWALLVSVATALVGVWMAAQFDWNQDLSAVPTSDRLARSVQIAFTPGFDSPLHLQAIQFSFSLGVDSISLWLVLMTVLLMPVSILASFTYIKERQKEFYAWMQALLAFMLGVFVARDLLLFYVCFELTLIPMFFIIGIWGGSERRYAAGKFFLFTFSGSVFTLAVVIFLGLAAGSFDLATVTQYAQYDLTDSARFWVFMGLAAGMAVKVPLFPVHTWLPLAHTEAPTAGSVILAGVLLKLGAYGLLRLAVPMGLIGPAGLMFPTVVKALAVLCIIGVIYGALVAWVQQDIKKLVAYSSVSHLGFCVLGLVALNDYGMQGSVLYMVNHGLSTGAMFLVIGMIYERYHTRDIHQLSGLAKQMPIMSFFFVFFTLSSIGLPGLNGYVSEFLTILGAFTSEHLGIGYGIAAAVGIILGAIYMLHMVARVIFGPLKVPHVHEEEGHKPLSRDLNGREITVLVPLAIAVVLLGVLPTPVLNSVLEPVRMVRQPVTAPIVGPTAQSPAEVAMVQRP
ncbi:MAG: NADH-quinone oxidoreductase subunit M [Phycisphaerales bacterium]|nr:NADH-quinone oxidoreductase subunit M [Phycisphaerales bacterium]